MLLNIGEAFCDILLLIPLEYILKAYFLMSLIQLFKGI